MKNEHIVWAYAERDDGTGQVLIIGLTDVGIAFMNDHKKSLVINPPGKGFANIVQVVVFQEKDKATLKARLREAGVAVSEAH